MKDEVERARHTSPDKESWDTLSGKQQFKRH